MTAIAVRDECAIPDGPGIGVFLGGFPASKRFAVEERSKSWFDRSPKGSGAGHKQAADANHIKEVWFHAAEIKPARLLRKEKTRLEKRAFSYILPHEPRGPNAADRAGGPRLTPPERESQASDRHRSHRCHDPRY